MRITSAVVLLVALAGCAERAGIGANPGPDDPVTSSPAPGPGTPIPAPSALEVSPRPGLVDVRRHIWDRAEIVGPREIRVEFYGGVEECEGLDRVDVEETRDRVTITLFVGRVPTAEVCIEIAVLKAVTVHLDRPLGDREVVDGAAR